MVIRTCSNACAHQVRHGHRRDPRGPARHVIPRKGNTPSDRVQERREGLSGHRRLPMHADGAQLEQLRYDTRTGPPLDVNRIRCPAVT